MKFAARLRPPPSLWILVFMVSIGPFGDTEYTPAMPSIAQSLGVNYSQIILTMTSYLLGYAVSQLFYGPLSDRYGRRPAMIVGAITFLIGSIICLLSPNLATMIVGRFIQAMGACAGAILSNAAVRDSFPERERGHVYAKINAAFALAPGLGPMVGAYVDHLFHWRINFVILLVLSAILLAAVFFCLPETNKHLNKTALQPTQILSNYLKLFRDPYYGCYVVILGLCVGLVYNCLTEAPSLVIKILHLGPLSIVLISSGVMLGFIAGSLLCHFLYRRLSENTIIGSALLLILSMSWALLYTNTRANPTLAVIMIPIIILFVGVAMVLPMATARAMQPFKSITGNAAAALGFTQMGIASLATGILSLEHQTSILVMPICFIVMSALALMVFIVGILFRPKRHRITV